MNTDNFTLSTGEEIPLVFTVKSGVRNIVLRPKIIPKHELHITMPRWAPKSRAHAFAEEKRRWLERIFARAPQKARVADGDVITIFGRDVLIRHKPLTRAGAYLEKDDADICILNVCGPAEFLERRARDKVKELFLARVKEIVRTVPASSRPKKITVRDTTSRWGSCSASGTVSLSYRLAFAPPEIMRYVVMHELSHLSHMDHSAKFWRQVSELYGPGVERAKSWLSKNGQSLHRYF
ncbi:MAG: M48 family metallopeptidase [Rickettsiales bacterium]|jgi:predicted metal-dependent hydrolase|nr:M48 family metallopeptidase [Rickettsiales bacterium]